MQERNSEGWLTKAFTIGGLVLAGLVGAVGALSDAGLAEHWPGFATVAAIVLGIGKALGDYSASRPEKHKAMAQREAVAKLANPTSGPAQPK